MVSNRVQKESVCTVYERFIIVDSNLIIANNPYLLPTAPPPVRQAVTTYLNTIRNRGRCKALFRLDYESSEDWELDSSADLLLIEYYLYSTDIPHSIANLTSGRSYVSNELRSAALLRISEDRLLPLGLWLWDFKYDTLLLIEE